MGIAGNTACVFASDSVTWVSSIGVGRGEGWDAGGGAGGATGGWY